LLNSPGSIPLRLAGEGIHRATNAELRTPISEH
jgi:hypothetical protein